MSDYETIRPHLDEIGIDNLPFTPEADLDFLRSRAIAAVEVENSLWVARDMPDYGKGIPLIELAAKPRRFKKPRSRGGTGGYKTFDDSVRDRSNTNA